MSGGLRARAQQAASGNVVRLEPAAKVPEVPISVGMTAAPEVHDNADLLAELDELMQQPAADADGTTDAATQSQPAAQLTASPTAAVGAVRALPVGAPRLTQLAPQQAIDLINAAHFVAPASGEMAIYREGTDAETGLPTLTVVSLNSLRVEYAPYTVSVPSPGGSVKAMPAVEFWFRSKHRREYLGGVILQPEGTAPTGCYNLWQGYGITRQPGDAQPMVDHVVMLCGGDAQLADYVLSWLAHCVQRPGSRPEVALVLKGGRGTGKGTLFRVMLMIFGKHALHLTQPKHLVGNFNSHLRSALFVFADECHWPGDKAAEGVLKGLITEPTLAVEMKGRDVFTATNRIKLSMATNNDWAVPAGADERRYCVIDVSADRAQDHAYFCTLNDWIDNGGAAIFLDHLLCRDLTGFNVRAVPRTAALDRQKIESMPAVDRWIMEALDTGTGLAGDEWTEAPQRAECDTAVVRFDSYCRKSSARGTRPDTRTIGKRLNEIFGCGPATARRTGTLSRRAWTLPAITDARSMAARAFGLGQYTWGDA
jgi:Family of unknown function (DUF5906)